MKELHYPAGSFCFLKFPEIVFSAVISISRDPSSMYWRENGIQFPMQTILLSTKVKKITLLRVHFKSVETYK